MNSVDPVFMNREVITKKGNKDGTIVFMQSDSPSVTAADVSAGFSARKRMHKRRIMKIEKSLNLVLFIFHLGSFLKSI